MDALLSGFVTAFLLTYLIIPVIIRVAKERRIYDQPNERSSHIEPTPSLGGIAIFAGTVCGIVLWTPLGSFGVLQYILAAFVLIFLIGIFDDLLHLSPGKKLLGQCLVALILVYKAHILLTSLYGILGWHDLSHFTGFAFSLLIIVGIINAFNLIDGINGLAGSVGLLNCVAFGWWFHAVDTPALAVVAFSLAGAIVAFLRYNITPARIFMGDTGSLLLGTVCAMLAISFIETNRQLPDAHRWKYQAAPAIAVALLILPVLDTTTVMIRRLLKGSSPFKPDKMHIHHRLLALGMSHTQTTLLLLGVNVVYVICALLCHRQGTLQVIFMEFGLAICCVLLLSFFLRWKAKKAAKG
ncbi:MAG: MraY family glycosyltransferase [Saprospiraceae bacterium]|nr:MraY family glycosyltransferase [Saprospiraceae bacterium]